MGRQYAELGIGNNTFFNTEIEHDGSEHRVPGFFLPKNIDDVYIRLWVKKTVIVCSTKDGYKTYKKSKNAFKVLFGIGGTARVLI